MGVNLSPTLSSSTHSLAGKENDFAGSHFRIYDPIWGQRMQTSWITLVFSLCGTIKGIFGSDHISHLQSQ